MADTKSQVREQDVLKMRQFVGKMDSVEKARAALDALKKIRKAA
jgi:hypothetical protein